MKKMLLLLFLIWSISSDVSAHRGNTDVYGCHNDHINGGYHCHNDGQYNAQAEYDRGYREGYDMAYNYTSQGQGYTWGWEGTEAYGAGFEDGIAQGETDGEGYYQDSQLYVDSAEPYYEYDQQELSEEIEREYYEEQLAQEYEETTEIEEEEKNEKPYEEIDKEDGFFVVIAVIALVLVTLFAAKK